MGDASGQLWIFQEHCECRKTLTIQLEIGVVGVFTVSDTAMKTEVASQSMPVCLWYYSSILSPSLLSFRVKSTALPSHKWCCGMGELPPFTIFCYLKLLKRRKPNFYQWFIRCCSPSDSVGCPCQDGVEWRENRRHSAWSALSMPWSLSRESGDMSILSLALFWCMIICILNYCPVHRFMLNSGGAMWRCSPDLCCVWIHRQKKGGRYLMPCGSSVPEDGSGRLMMSPEKNPNMGMWFWEWIPVLLCFHHLFKY